MREFSQTLLESYVCRHKLWRKKRQGKRAISNVCYVPTTLFSPGKFRV